MVYARSHHWMYFTMSSGELLDQVRYLCGGGYNRSRGRRYSCSDWEYRYSRKKGDYDSDPEWLRFNFIDLAKDQL